MSIVFRSPIQCDGIGNRSPFFVIHYYWDFVQVPKITNKENRLATFFNQATLTYNGIVANSNITTGELVEVISAAKTAAPSTYESNEAITYVVNIQNSGATPITG